MSVRTEKFGKSIGELAVSQFKTRDIIAESGTKYNSTTLKHALLSTLQQRVYRY